MNKLTNDQIILKQILKQKRNESEDEMSDSDYFELYSASEVLKDYDISYDDVQYGIVGNGGDGGIDSIFTFLNGEIIKEDTEINTKQKNNKIELIIIQSKTSSKFSEDAIIKFRETGEDLFNLSNNPKKYTKRYNADLVERVNIFRNAYEEIMSTFPNLIFKYYYVTQGIEVHPNLQQKVEKLKTDIQNLFGGSSFEFHFIGAKELLSISRNIPSTSRHLEYSESSIGTDTGSYICLVNLHNYYDFISDNGSLARSIFEANVRDYQGRVRVNEGIMKTLKDENSDDFWYLNNGVTIITPKAISSGKKITIEDPQIVNGLQTSHEIYSYFSQKETIRDDGRRVLVRIICEEDEDARDRIIKATNSQTSIPPASLRSSDAIHRDIEDYLKSKGFYYDRKKNYYKNQGRPASKVISIPYMAQAMMAIVLKKPDSARARPSTLINSESEYNKIFNTQTPIELYHKVILIMKSSERFLKPNNCGHEIQRKDINNIRFYLAMSLGIHLAQSQNDINQQLVNIENFNISRDSLKSCLSIVISEYSRLGATDQVAKGPKLATAILQPKTVNDIINLNTYEIQHSLYI